MQTIQCDQNVDPEGLNVAEGMVSCGLCSSLRYDRETASTNSLAMSELQQSAIDSALLPRLYLTDLQTAGRGRLGRQWISDQRTLTFSMIVSTRTLGEKSELLSLATGVGVARAIEHVFAPYQVKLKWPNDIYLGGSKVAGILVEATQNASDARVVGIGINVGSFPDLADSSDAPPVTSLAAATGRPVSRYVLLEPVVHSVLESIGDLTDNANSVVDDFRSRCLLIGQSVRLSNGANEISGICQGMSDDGELILDTEGGQQTVRSGEASLIRKRGNRR